MARRRGRGVRGGRPRRRRVPTVSGATFNNDAGPIVRQTFTYHARFSGSTTVLENYIDPINSGSLFGVDVAQMAAVYQEFRCVGITITQYPAQSTASGTGAEDTGQAIGWRVMTSASAPNSVDDVMASAVSSYCNDHLTVPVVFRIRRSDFRRHDAYKWYHQDFSSPDPDTTRQGVLYHVCVGTNASTAIWTWIVTSTWEFRGFCQLNQYLLAKILPLYSVESKQQSAPGHPVARRAVRATPSADDDEKDTLVIVDIPPPAPTSVPETSGAP